MKLEEKLIKLRKEKAWSQEELAEKLNVTRQTISKWELGQTVPDTENLSKIATQFGMSITDLLDDNTDPITNTYKKETTDNKQSKLINLLTILLIAIVITIIVMISRRTISSNKIKNANNLSDTVSNMIDKFDSYSEQKQANGINTFVDTFFNVADKFESYFEEDDLDDENAETNEQSQNTATNFNSDEVANMINTAKAISESLNTTIKKEQETTTSKKFNQNFKSFYFGTTNGFFMNNFIDAVIKSNDENPNNIISVNYNGTEASNLTELRNMKKQFITSENYEIYYEYDADGYITKANILK